MVRTAVMHTTRGRSGSPPRNIRQHSGIGGSKKPSQDGLIGRPTHVLIDLTLHVLHVLPGSGSILLISLDRGCRVIEMRRVLHRQLAVLQLPLLKAGRPGLIEIDAGETSSWGMSVR